MTTKKIIRQIAKENGVTQKQVEHDMKEAIRAGMASKEPQAIAAWKEIAPDGKEPSIEEFLRYMAKKVNGSMVM